MQPNALDLFGEPIAANQDSERPAIVTPAQGSLQLPCALPANVFIGCSSWSFSGWHGLVYAVRPDGTEHTESKLASHGLGAYSQHPLLNAVGIDRGFYAPVPVKGLLAYAQQTPAGFKFLIKAPQAVTQSQTVHGALNPNHLDTKLAISQFIEPALAGLENKALALVFQFSPLLRPWVRDSAHWIARLDHFLGQLPRLPTGVFYAVELRDAELITPRLIHVLARHQAEYCVALHARLPNIARQAQAWKYLREQTPGPFIARWTLLPGMSYTEAKQRFAPFKQLAMPDSNTRHTLADLMLSAHANDQPAITIINNKAEGSAPLSAQALGQAILERQQA
jgi:uncharacterized protein YecE (DUF72 family)